MKSNSSAGNSSSPFGISDFSSSSKYGGLLEEKKSKKLFRMYQNLLNYMDSMLPGLYSLHSIISFIRTLQMFGVMFLSNFASLHPRDKVVYKFFNWLSILWNIIPIEYRDKCSFVVAVVYFALIFSFFILITVAAKYYEQNGSLSLSVIYIIHLFISIVGYIIHVPCLEICFETVSKMIAKEETYHHVAFNIVTIVLTLVTFVFYYFFYRKLYSYSFIFRPTSFMCINGVQQMGSLQVQSFQAIGVGIAAYLPRIPQGILTIALAFAALSCYFTMYRSFSLVSFLHNTIFLTFAIFGFGAYIVFAIFIFLKIHMNVAGLFIFLALLFVIFIISHFITQKIIRKSLVYLDNIYENKELLLDEPDSNKLYICSTIGFHFAHPSSLDFTIFKYITEKEPDNPLYLTIYGKFVAIYPELSDTLNYIIRTIIQRKMHGIIVKQALSQSRIIFQQRESNLTSELKKKLNKVQKDISAAKRRLRHVWDQVIQGNIAELDSAIANAYSMKSKCDAQFNLLLVQLPNNRFLYRTYSTYLIEVSNDVDKYKDAADKVRMLSRGIKVHEDHTQELGLHAFPQLPSMIIMNMPLGSSTANEVSESVVFTEEIDDETISRKQEDNRTLMDLISSLHIPSLVTTNTIVGIVAILGFLIAVILLPLILSYKRRIKKPLAFSDNTAWARFYASAGTAYAHLYLLNKLNVVNFTEYNMESFANETSLVNQIKYAISQLIASMKSISDYRDYHIGDKYIDTTRFLLYNGSTTYTEFSSDMTTNKTSTVSLLTAFNDIVMRLTEIVDMNSSSITRYSLMSPSMRNPFYNIETVVDKICSVTNNLTAFIESRVDFMGKVMTIDQYAVSLFLIIVLIIVMIVVYVRITRDKETIYRTLLVLPKNVVSQISESFRSVNKDDSMKSGALTSTTHVGNDIERNRQEENLMKVLTAASDERTNSTELNLILIALLVFMISAVLINIIVARMYIDVGMRLKENCQHLDNILGVASFLDLMAMQVNDITTIMTKRMITDTADVKSKFYHLEVYKFNLTEYYSALRYGYGNGHPFPDFRELVKQAKVLAKCDQSHLPLDTRDGLNCFSPDILVKYTYIFFHSIIDPIITNNSNSVNIDNLMLADEIAMFRIYDDFLYKAYLEVDTRVDDLMNQKVPAFVAAAIVLAFVILICFICTVFITRIMNNKLKYALSLLLACQTSIVMQNSYIMSVLSGNFSRGSGDSSTRDNAFYDNLVEELPDAIVVTSGANYKVISSNKAANALFKEVLTNNSFSSYIQSSNFSPETNSQLNRLFDPTMKTSSCNVQYISGDPDKKFLFISRTSALIGDNVIFTVRNTTQTFVYNKLISEERAKSDQLLATILPASLVPRVQAGEKNISFSVGSATISFIDIVEFTPWCSANTAQVVTGVLNDIFTEFDTIINSLPVMERIKCIGDCYMAAGGIFAETPNLLQFARATVDFGLEAINAIKRVNEKHGMSLRVRVGQHIGGPIVAGVIGIGKPTFEIFGPAISYAQQMEHNGIPMKVHVSRALYELIYGGNYKIEERGEIQIKQGKVLTYLVDGYTS